MSDLKDKFAGLSVTELQQQLGTDDNGLTSGQAGERLAKDGPNQLRSHPKRGALKLLLKQFRSSLIYLLLAACVISFLLGDNNDGYIILAILVINCGLGFFQEYRSENAIQKLQKLVSKEVLVQRDGKQILVKEVELVCGDLVVLREGDVVPADIRLTRADNFSVNESQLTGETAAVTKTATGKEPLAFAGSVVEQGEAEGYVYATGAQTQLGKIAHLSSSTRRTTQYEQQLGAFSIFLIRVTLLTLAVVFVLKLLVGGNDSVATLGLFIIALAVTVVPEAMPVIATVTLSRGAMELAKQHVIVKTLTAVEDVGDINILCSDKTGTLTENKLEIQKVVTDDPELFNRLAMASLETLDEKRKKFQSAFDRAFLNYVPATQQTHHFKRLEELPFDPASRRRRVVFEDGDKQFLVEVGSAETLLQLTRAPKHQSYLKTIKKDGEEGLRHLGIAYKEVKYTKDFDILKHEDGLKFVGFAVLDDPLRPTAKHTIALAGKLGVQVKILSGDSREVTQYVARQVGLLTAEQTALTGDEIDKFSDEKLSATLQTTHAFARLNPEQKYRIIKLLKQGNNVVGYQGDGINDAPALKLADVAIAVSNATDVAQDSADILLLRSDLGVIVNGIRAGRAIFSNINKYIRYTMIGNFGNFFALSLLFLLSGASLPLLPVQVLLTNILTDIPLLTIATDNVGEEELARPSKFNVHALMFVSLFLGTTTAIFEIIFYVMIRQQSVAFQQTALYIFLTITGLAVILSVRNRGHFWNAPKLPLSMKLAFGLVAILSVALTYGRVGHLFSFVQPQLPVLFLVLLMTAIYLIVLDRIKVWFYTLKIENPS